MTQEELKPETQQVKAERRAKERPISEREDTFALTYIENGGVAAAAARAAKYKGDNQALAVQGAKLLRKPKIQRLIAEKRAEMRVKAKVIPEEVVAGLRRVLALCDAGTTIGDRANALRALELLGRIAGVFLEDNAQSRADVNIVLR